MNRPLKIALFGSSLVSSLWNGEATYYRGILRALHRRGHEITFYEPDAFDRQRHRDLDRVGYARSVVYQPTEQAAEAAVKDAGTADVVIKASGVGVLDAFLENAVLAHRQRGALVLFWDVDAPATLDHLERKPADPFRTLIPLFDGILTYGGGDAVVRSYTAYGAQACVPVYNALDPATHYPVPYDSRFACALAFMGNRMPDREARMQEYFFSAAQAAPERAFILGGSGWDRNVPTLANLRVIGHVFTRDHNAFNSTPLAVLNINRESMARYGYSPPTRIFEVAGAAGCVITDAWPGINQFLEPGVECLVASSGAEVVSLLRGLTPERAADIGHAAYRRIRGAHTYAHRAVQLEQTLVQMKAYAKERAA